MTLLHQAAQKAVEARRSFEAWYEADAMPSEADWFKRDPDAPDEYDSAHTHVAWKAWQAALQQQPEPVTLSDGREQFEAWLRARWPGAATPIDEKTSAGFYIYNENNFYWEAWQAARSAPPALQHQEVPREPVATLRVTLEYDDGDGPLEIVCHGTELNMRRLDARLKFLHRLEKQSNDCAASPSTTRQQEVGSGPTHEQMMAGYAVACSFKVYEAQAFKLAEEMYRAMLAAAPSTPENAGGGKEVPKC